MGWGTVQEWGILLCNPYFYFWSMQYITYPPPKKMFKCLKKGVEGRTSVLWSWQQKGLYFPLILDPRLLQAFIQTSYTIPQPQ